MATNVEIATRKVSSTNPATGELVRELDCASDAEVRAAVAQAHSAQPAWAALSVEERIRILRNFQRLLHENKTEVATLITQEAGKPYVEALLTEVLVVLDSARFLISNTFAFMREQPVPHGSVAMKAKKGRILREPYGVIGIVSPWNYPLSIPAVDALAAVVTGNAGVLKPSEFTSLLAFKLHTLLRGAGVPKEAFRVMVGDGGTGAGLLNSVIDKSALPGHAPQCN